MIKIITFVGFAITLLVYLGIALKDILYHFSLDGTSTEVTKAETLLHNLAGTLVTTILVVLIFGNLLPITSDQRIAILSICPALLAIVGLVDELVYHRVRCKNDPLENWHHALLHFSMGSSLVLGYVHWY